MTLKARLILCVLGVVFSFLGLIVVEQITAWGLVFNGLGIAAAGVAAFLPTKVNMFDVKDVHPAHQLGCGWMDCAVCNPDKEE